MCNQKYVEERDLVRQINALFQKVALCDDWKDKVLKQWQKDSNAMSKSSHTSAQNHAGELQRLDEKQKKLLGVYLDGSISKEEYTTAKKDMVDRKVEITEQQRDFGRKGNSLELASRVLALRGMDHSKAKWLEPMKAWIQAAHQAGCLAMSENLEEKRDFLQKIGSNYHLVGRKAAVELASPWNLAAAKDGFSIWSG